MSLPVPNDLFGVPPEVIDAIASERGKSFNGIKTNQIRNVFAAIAAIRQQYRQEKAYSDAIHRSMVLLKPKLAYAAGRQVAVRPFQEFLSQAIDAVIKSSNKAKALENFFALIESVVAYHKFNNGRDY